MNDQVTRAETSELLRLAEQTLAQGIAGDFVELGCYRGDTSVLLGRLLQHPLEQRPDRPTTRYPRHPAETLQPSTARHLYLYDSFAGLPEKTREDASGAGANFRTGALLVTKREVLAKLRRHGLTTATRPLPDTPTVIVKKAWFADLTTADLPEHIAFAFCDGDLYDSIRTSLRLVLPRLAERGIIIVHDYNNPELPGSSRAVDEFLRAHPDFRLRIHRTLAILTRPTTP